MATDELTTAEIESTMIHEVVVAMRSADGRVEDITDVIHAHPAINKAVQYAFEDVPVETDH